MQLDLAPDDVVGINVVRCLRSRGQAIRRRTVACGCSCARHASAGVGDRSNSPLLLRGYAQMEPAIDPTVDYQDLVRSGYNRCSSAYSLARGVRPERKLSLLTSRLAVGARVLDLGCGSGVPIARALADGFTVVGEDASEKQVERARHNVPAADFHRCDLLSYRPEGRFDAITMFLDQLRAKQVPGFARGRWVSARRAWHHWSWRQR